MVDTEGAMDPRYVYGAWLRATNQLLLPYTKISQEHGRHIENCTPMKEDNVTTNQGISQANSNPYLLVHDTIARKDIV